MCMDFSGIQRVFSQVSGKTAKIKTVYKIIFGALAVVAAASAAVAVIKTVQTVKLKNRVRLLTAESSAEACAADDAAPDVPEPVAAAEPEAAIPEAAEAVVPEVTM